MAGYGNQAWAGEEYPEVRAALAHPYRSWASEDIEALLASQGIEAEDIESFLSGLKDVGRIAAGALPALGTIAGTAFGGPVGAAIGGAAGQLAGRALGTALGPAPGAPAPGRAPVRPAGLPAMPGALPLPPPAPAGAPSAAALMQLLARPETQQALLSMLLGAIGRRNVPVGGTTVPVGAFANALGVLANRASAEYAEQVAMSSEGMPAYLQDYAGEAAVDPAVPEMRATRLLELIAEADIEDIDAGEAEDYAVSWRTAYGGARPADAYYDAIEQAEMALAGEEW